MSLSFMDIFQNDSKQIPQKAAYHSHESSLSTEARLKLQNLTSSYDSSTLLQVPEQSICIPDTCTPPTRLKQYGHYLGELFYGS